MSNKRPLPQGSPPPTGPSKHKKAKPSISAPGLSRVNSVQTPTPAGSSPPYYADSPRARSRSRSRSRSVSVAVGGANAADRDGTVPPGGQGPEGDVDVDADGEDEDIDYSEDEFGVNQNEIDRQKEDLRVLLDHFDPAQMDRYESYRRSGLAKASVRKLVNQVLQQSVSPSILTVVRGFAKVFVGEIVEKAREVSSHTGPLAPEDLREAYRRYTAEHDGSIGPPLKKMFVR